MMFVVLNSKYCNNLYFETVYFTALDLKQYPIGGNFKCIDN